MSSHSVRPPLDPPILKAEVVQRKVVRMQLSFGSTSPPLITPVVFATYFPNGGLGFRNFRINKITAWGPDVGEIPSDGTGIGSYAVGIQIGSGSSDGDGAVFTDAGTQGQRRAAVSVIPNIGYRIVWFSITDATTQLFVPSISPSPPATRIVNVIVDVDAEIQTVV